MKGLIACALAVGLAGAAHADDGHDWLQDNKADIKGAMGLLYGAEFCKLKTSEWRADLSSRMGLWIGNHTTEDNSDEFLGMLNDAKRVTERAYHASSKAICAATERDLPILERRSAAWDE